MVFPAAELAGGLTTISQGIWKSLKSGRNVGHLEGL